MLNEWRSRCFKWDLEDKQSHKRGQVGAKGERIDAVEVNE